MLAISQLPHVYLVQYGKYIPRFSYFAVISRKNVKNSENIGHNWSIAITNAYHNSHPSKGRI